MALDVKGFTETSFLDWDGKIVSVVYLPQCNFRCPFCHNAGLVLSSQSYATVPLETIFSFLESHRDFIDGICITGGEPCWHKQLGLFEFMRQIKDLRFLIKLDTNGADPACLLQMLNGKTIDYIAMDVKGPLDERYDKLSGVKTDLSAIKKSIAIIMHSGVPYEFRVTVVPGLLNYEDLVDMAKSIAGAQKFVLQQFKSENALDPALRQKESFSREKIEKMAEAAREFIANTVIRGA